MPALVQGSTAYGPDTAKYQKINEYAAGIDLTPGSPLHSRILAYVMARARASMDVMQKRHPSWRRIDETLTAYIDLSEAERAVKDKDSRKPVSIVFPYSYAILDTLVAYMDSLFLRSPIFRFEGNSPEDYVGAAMLEKVIEIHCKRTKANLALHTVFRDGMAYGIGAAFPIWKRINGFKTRTTPLGVLREEALLFEGNAVDTVDPYRLLLDPIVGAKDVQAGEFVGFGRTTNLLELREQASDNANIVNVEYLSLNGAQKSSIFSSDPSGRDSRHGMRTTEASGGAAGAIDLIFMYAKIIPKDLGLGESEFPEKWLFCVAADKYVIQAQKLNADHNMFPVALSAPTYDGYSHTPLSRLEMLDGMQETINWLFNSHITNVRKAVNDMFIVDPFQVNIADMQDPEPGKIIRLRRAAWGKDVRNSIQQFQVNDVTRQNLADTSIISSLMHRLSGTDDAAMGMLREGGPERLTGQEFQGTRQGMLGRMEAMVRVISSQFLQDLAYMLASHTQQMMTEEVYITTTGRWQEVFSERFASSIQQGKMKVSPQDLQVDYDVTPLDPTSSSQDASLWLQLYQIITERPELAGLYDLPRIFKHVALQLGAQNVDDFVLQQQPMAPALMPTEQVMQGAQQGNMIPIGEVANALRGG